MSEAIYTAEDVAAMIAEAVAAERSAASAFLRDFSTRNTTLWGCATVIDRGGHRAIKRHAPSPTLTTVVACGRLGLSVARACSDEPA